MHGRGGRQVTTPKRQRTIKTQRQQDQRRTARARQEEEARRNRYSRADYPTRGDDEPARWRP